MTGDLPKPHLSGALADIDRAVQLPGALPLGVWRWAAPGFLASQIGNLLHLHLPFAVNLDEIVDGFVVHASIVIMTVSAPQGDLDLLGRGPRGKQGQTWHGRRSGVANNSSQKD
jgi:hypothetical protein